MTATTLSVRGQKVRTQTQRRYVVVVVRPGPVTTTRGTYPAFARVDKRTDNLDTARTHKRRNHAGSGAFAVVVDTTTGQEVT